VGFEGVGPQICFRRGAAANILVLRGRGCRGVGSEGLRLQEILATGIKVGLWICLCLGLGCGG
jgi:hypothetical protein